MSQQRQNQWHMMKDTTYTKIFVGGLAWETQRETMKRYFEQFGEILEAVVITDKTTGRSKGYGFVTFKEAEAAFRACQNPSPVIDGRRANCNIASFGAQKNHPHIPQYVASPGTGRFRPTQGLMATPTPTQTYPGSSSSTYFHHQPSVQPPFPYSLYGYTGYSHDNMYHMNYYGVYGQQQVSPYYYPTTTGAGGASTGTIGYFHNMYPYINPYAQSNQSYGYGVQYPQPHQIVQQYPFLPQHLISSSPGILSLPTSTLPLPTTTTVTTTTATPGARATVGVLSGTGSAGASQTPTGAASEKNSAT